MITKWISVGKEVSDGMIRMLNVVERQEALIYYIEGDTQFVWGTAIMAEVV